MKIKIIAIDLSKQQALDTDPKSIHQINFTGNIDRATGATMFFIIEETKETVLDFHKELERFSIYLFALI